MGIIRKPAKYKVLFYDWQSATQTHVLSGTVYLFWQRDVWVGGLCRTKKARTLYYVVFSS